MKLVIDKIGMPGDYSRTIVNLDNISILALEGSGENEKLLVGFADGLLRAYMVNNHQFGLPDGTWRHCLRKHPGSHECIS